MRKMLPVVMLGLVASTGCGSSEELVQCRAELEETRLQVDEWKERFDRESQRWAAVETSVTEAVPAALEEVHAERDRIIEMVPEQVQGEVEAYLDRYFTTVMSGFASLEEKSTTIELELSATRRQLDRAETMLEDLGAETSEIRETGTSIHDTLQEGREARVQAAEQVTAIVEQLRVFDQTRVNCKGCDTRLTLSRSERETITAFHQNLAASLTELQMTLGGSSTEP